VGLNQALVPIQSASSAAKQQRNSTYKQHFKEPILKLNTRAQADACASVGLTLSTNSHHSQKEKRSKKEKLAITLTSIKVLMA